MTDESIFAAALALPSSDRGAYLDRACSTPKQRREVEALLAAHDASNPLDRPVPDLGLTGAYAKRDADGPSVGDRVGPYKLLEKIGEGGMGEVWVADQTEPVKRRVALKLIRDGLVAPSALARFEAERQALALMDHPNIAKVLDAGSDNGRPFFVMELVKGVPITTFCDDNKLTPESRLRLFVSVCQAIQHAHTKGIIHRDIKPGNVLVAFYDEVPVVKVIDFGIAKALHQPLTERTLYTGFGALVGTLEYMSPEQAKLNALDIDTRSDVYSLGVLLYELLTGSLPFQRDRLRKASLEECLRLIREEEPPRMSARLSSSTATLPTLSRQRSTEPSKLSRLLRGELDWIAMKALEKDRNRRYESPSALARDVERHLTGEPVEACPPTWRYRAAKFAKRNRATLSVASAFGLLLIISTVVSTAFAIRAEAKLRLARESLDLFVGEALKLTPWRHPDRNVPVRELVNRLETRLEQGGISPLVEAATRRLVGRWLDELGEFARAERHLRRAVAFFTAELGPDTPETLLSRVDLAHALMQNDDLTDKQHEATELYQTVLPLLKRTLGEENEVTLRVRCDLGWLLGVRNQVGEALQMLEAAHADQERLNRDGSPSRVLTAICLAQFLTVNDLDRAERLATEARRRACLDFGPGTFLDNLATASLTRCLLTRGQAAGALDLYDNLISNWEKLLGPAHRQTLGTKFFRILATIATRNRTRTEKLLSEYRQDSIEKRKAMPRGADEFLCLLGDAWLLQSSNPAKAIETYQRAEQLPQGGSRRDTLARDLALLFQADCLIHLNEYARADILLVPLLERLDREPVAVRQSFHLYRRIPMRQIIDSLKAKGLHLEAIRWAARFGLPNKECNP